MLKYGRKAVNAYSWKNLKKCLGAPVEVMVATLGHPWILEESSRGILEAKVDS